MIFSAMPLTVTRSSMTSPISFTCLLFVFRVYRQRTWRHFSDRMSCDLISACFSSLIFYSINSSLSVSFLTQTPSFVIRVLSVGVIISACRERRPTLDCCRFSLMFALIGITDRWWICSSVLITRTPAFDLRLICLDVRRSCSISWMLVKMTSDHRQSSNTSLTDKGLYSLLNDCRHRVNSRDHCLPDHCCIARWSTFVDVFGWELKKMKSKRIIFRRRSLPACLSRSNWF